MMNVEDGLLADLLDLESKAAKVERKAANLLQELTELKKRLSES